MKIMK